jgi:hypothetical protein
MIFHPLRDPRALLMLKELSVCSTFPLVSGSGLTFLELTAELFLEVDNSRALLKPHLNAESPALKRARSFNKELRKARSFRNARELSTSRNSSAVNSRNVSPEPETNGNVEQTESSFSIKRALGSRRGWKIMADDGGMVDGVALRRVVTIIKDMELQGFAVPERITIKVP